MGRHPESPDSVPEGLPAVVIHCAMHCYRIKDDEWFTHTIIVDGDTVVVKINGQQVVRWTQPADWDGGREGPGRTITGPGTIALQAHDAKSAVLYKNIRIRPLD